MFDLTMFFSMLCAFLAATVTMEILSFCVGLYIAKKNMKRQQEFEQEYAKAVAEGKVPPGIDPMQMMMGGMPMPMSPDPTTVSGETALDAGTGQYL